MTGVAAIWKHLQPFRRELWILACFGFISSLANGSVPYITGRFFDALIALSKHQETISWGVPLWGLLLAAWAGIQLVANHIDWVIDRLRRRVDMEIHFNIQAEGFTHLLRLPLAYHKDVHMNGVLQKLSQAGWRISDIVHTGVNIGPQLLSIVIGITLAASINGLLASVLVIGVAFYLALLIRILLPVAAIDSAAHRSWNDGWNDAASAVTQIESVKQATAEEYEARKVHDALLVKTRGLWHKLHLIWSNVGFFQRIIVFATQLVIFILSVRFVAQGTLTVGQLVALNGYALMFFGPFALLGYNWQTIQNGISSAAHAEEIFREPKEQYIPEHITAQGRIAGNVAFKNVSFSYGLNQPAVLQKVNFEVLSGQSVAFVGESGVGKSTTISLISGYYFPQEGSVLIDGADTRALRLTELREQIAVVPQEVTLFNDTIKANIRYGCFAASDEKVIRAAREVHLNEFIETLPHRYDTIVGERGIKLSVGQKQRVAIARAMLRNPSILILDEPTSAFDAQTEKIVTEALERLMRGRTTFIIAHRLSTVRKADTILVFEKGNIVEQGTHQELLAKKRGAYRRLYEYQIGLH